MILYSDSEMIVPEKKILLPQNLQDNITSSQQKIILPEDIEEQNNRREFMLFSLACMGMIIFPTKSKSNPIVAGLGIAYSIFKIYQYGKELIKAYNKWKHLRYIGKVRIPYLGIPTHSSYNKKESFRIAERLSDVTGLKINSSGMHSALKYISKKPEFW